MRKVILIALIGFLILFSNVSTFHFTQSQLRNKGNFGNKAHDNNLEPNRQIEKSNKFINKFISVSISFLLINSNFMPDSFATLVSSNSFLSVNSVSADELETLPVQQPKTISALEKSIINLEKSNTRSEAVQSFADLYETAATKTLLVRSKYKYVRPS
jgi:hypothetical protein